MTDVELPENAEERILETLTTIDSREDLREAATSIFGLLRLEDEDWTPVTSGSQVYEGIQLEDLQDRSERIRSSMILSPVMDRGAQLRHSYVWSKGIHLPDLKPDNWGSKTGPDGAKERLYRRYLDKTNQRYVFSATAQEEMERALYSDGNFFLLGDNSTKALRRVPLAEITAFICNPDHSEEVWAWQRTWQKSDPNGKTTQQQAWYYTDDCPLPKDKRVKTQINNVKVDHTKTFLVHSVNRMVGYPLGLPDAIAVIAWAKLYSDFLKHGYVMSRALASIAFRATVTTKKQGERAVARSAAPAGAGRTVVTGTADGLQSLPTAGRGYDFGSGRPLAAMIATGVQVSIVHLLSDPGAAGSSYGSASNLDLPTKRAVVARQRSWISYFQRVLEWLGAEDPEVSFPSLEEPDFYREVQALVLGWRTGNIQPIEMRRRLLELLDISTDDDTAIKGVLLPDNAETLKIMADVKAPSTPPPSGASTAAPDQGQSNGAGNSGDSHDLRSDGIGEALRAISDQETRDLMRELLEELRDAKDAA